MVNLEKTLESLKTEIHIKERIKVLQLVNSGVRTYVDDSSFPGLPIEEELEAIIIFKNRVCAAFNNAAFPLRPLIVADDNKLHLLTSRIGHFIDTTEQSIEDAILYYNSVSKVSDDIITYSKEFK